MSWFLGFQPRVGPVWSWSQAVAVWQGVRTNYCRWSLLSLRLEVWAGRLRDVTSMTRHISCYVSQSVMKSLTLGKPWIRWKSVKTVVIFGTFFRKPQTDRTVDNLELSFIPSWISTDLSSWELLYSLAAGIRTDQPNSLLQGSEIHVSSQWLPE